MTRPQRRHARYEVALMAEVSLGTEVLAASTDNLSLGGAALVLERSPSEGTVVTVSLFLTQDGIEDPNERPIEAGATVVWSLPRDDGRHVMGVQFDSLDATQRAQLERFLAALS
ncbi:MAG: PilZ domain-containing protein [Myxococcota bacterium]